MQDRDGARQSSDGSTTPTSEQRAPVLIVDDYPSNLTAFRGILEDPRHELFLACSGREAIGMVEKKDFAAILLDVRMPDLNGYDTAALIRRRPGSKTTPILFMTAFDAPAHEITEAYALGTDFIKKPVQDEVLKSKIAIFVDLYFRRQSIHPGVQAKLAAMEQTILRLQSQLDRCTCGCVPASPSGGPVHEAGPGAASITVMKASV